MGDPKRIFTDIVGYWQKDKQSMQDRIVKLESQVKSMKCVFDRATDIRDRSNELSGEFYNPLNHDYDLINKTAHEILTGVPEATEILESGEELMDSKECFTSSSVGGYDNV